MRGVLKAYELEDGDMLEALAERSLMSARRVLAVHGGGLREEPKGAEFAAAFDRLVAHLHEGGMLPNQATTRAATTLVDALRRRQAQSAAILERAAGLNGTGGDASGANTGATGGDSGAAQRGDVGTKEERDRATVDRLARHVKAQRRDRALPLDQSACDGDILVAYDALCHQPPRLPEPKSLALANGAAATGYRHRGKQGFTHKRRNALEQRAYIEGYFTACCQGGAFPAPKELTVSDIDARSGVVVDPEAPDEGGCPHVMDGEAVLVAHFLATLDFVRTAQRRALPLSVESQGRYYDSLIDDTREIMVRENLTVTASLEKALARGLESNYGSGRKRDRDQRDSRRTRKADTSSSDLTSDSDLSDSSSGESRKRKRGKAPKKPKPKPKPKGRGKTEGASGVCYTWARREFGGKGAKCKGCKYAHKFESNRQKKKVRRELKELDG